MFDLTIHQAINVWSELETAFRGENHYGGDTAEIYIYQMIPYSPRYSLPVDTSLGSEARTEAGEIASQNLRALIELFCNKHENVKEVTVDEREFREVLASPIYHRVHVRVIRTPEDAVKTTRAAAKAEAQGHAPVRTPWEAS